MQKPPSAIGSITKAVVEVPFPALGTCIFSKIQGKCPEQRDSEIVQLTELELVGGLGTKPCGTVSIKKTREDMKVTFL